MLRHFNMPVALLGGASHKPPTSELSDSTSSDIFLFDKALFFASRPRDLATSLPEVPLEAPRSAALGTGAADAAHGAPSADAGLRAPGGPSVPKE